MFPSTVSLLAAAALAGFASASPINPRAVTPCGIKNVMIIVLENADKTAVLQDTYMGTTLKQKGYFMNSYNGVTHPSQPNYVAMVAGSYYTCTSDSNCNLAKVG
ncbi:UNVERIFIED_CONTAM: hypothetical protein HDU68_003576 [Siphonaria sp. JEL0065]|nr:hypothetical protein HDU68_003576 [Siphonaria sp. JEL0065]